MGTITLIRHGQASFGEADYDQLTELGYRQGRELGRWFNQCASKFDSFVTGSLKRHIQTAEACFETLQDDLQPQTAWRTEPGFNEYDHMQMLHLYEPRFQDPAFVRQLFVDNPNPQKEFQRIFTGAFARWMDGRFDEEYHEPWVAFRARCITGLENLMSGAGRSEHIAVFTSGGPITAICQHLLQLPDNQVADLNSRIANASLTKLLFQPGRVSLSTMNSYAHFEQLPEDALITYR
jgi:broad specificity phosphatase PhoE